MGRQAAEAVSAYASGEVCSLGRTPCNCPALMHYSLQNTQWEVGARGGEQVRAGSIVPTFLAARVPAVLQGSEPRGRQTF